MDITSQSDQDLAVHDGQVATPDVKTPEPADDVMPPQEDEVDDSTEVDPTR